MAKADPDPARELERVLALRGHDLIHYVLNERWHAVEDAALDQWVVSVRPEPVEESWPVVAVCQDRYVAGHIARKHNDWLATR